MRHRVIAIALTACLAAATVFLARHGSAGPEKIAFPADFKDHTRYTIADRYDVKQYRELYATPAAVKAAKEGKPLPDGTILTLVQYKAQVDAQGIPVKDAKGRFMKGDLIAYTVMEKRKDGARSIPMTSATESGSTPPSPRTASSTTRPTTKPASSATSPMISRTT